MRKLILILFLVPLFTIGQSNYDSLFVEYSNAKTDTGRIELSYELGIHFFYVNLDSSQHYFEKTLLLAREAGNLEKKALGISWLGNVDLRRGDFQLALEKHLKSLAISDDIGDEYGIARSYSNLSIVSVNMGNYQSAMAYLIESITITKAQLEKTPHSDKHLLNLSHSYGNLANLHIYLGGIGSDETARLEYKKGIAVSKKSLILSEKLIASKNAQIRLDSKKGECIAYSNLGQIFYLLQEYDSAMKYSNAGIALYTEYMLPTGIPFCISNIGNVHAAKEEYAEAVDMFKEAIDGFKKLGFTSFLPETYNSMANAYIDYSNNEATSESNKLVYIQEALSYGLKGYTLALEISTVSAQRDIAYTLKQIYGLLGNDKEAMRYANIFITTNDSLFSINKIRALEDLEAKYQNELNQSKIEKQQLVIEKKEKEKLLWIGSFAFILILVGVLFRFRYQKALNEREHLLNEINLLKQTELTKIVVAKSSVDKNQAVLLDREKIENKIEPKLNDTDWNILQLIYENPIISIKDIADQVFLSVDGASSSLRKMYRLLDVPGTKNKKLALIMAVTKISSKA